MRIPGAVARPVVPAAAPALFFVGDDGVVEFHFGDRRREMPFDGYWGFVIFLPAISKTRRRISQAISG